MPIKQRDYKLAPQVQHIFNGNNLMEINLDAYFNRINFSAERIASLEVLKHLHYLHPLAIPFENINPFLGLSVPLQLDKLQPKLVIAHIGGTAMNRTSCLKLCSLPLVFRSPV